MPVVPPAAEPGGASGLGGYRPPVSASPSEAPSVPGERSASSKEDRSSKQGKTSDSDSDTHRAMVLDKIIQDTIHGRHYCLVAKVNPPGDNDNMFDPKEFPMSPKEELTWCTTWTKHW